MPLDFMQDEDIFSQLDEPTTEYHPKGFCQGQRTSQCVFSNALILSNSIFTVLLFYQLIVVYIVRRGKRFIPCCSDLRLWILLIALLNGIIVQLYLLKINLELVINGFFILEIFRFVVLFSLCLLYSSAASKNLISYRKQVIIGMIFLSITSNFLMVQFGVQMHTKIQNDHDFGKISCTDPLYLQLKTPPILMSILFCIITWKISSNISNFQKSMNICEFKNQFEKNEALRVQRRIKTLEVL